MKKTNNELREVMQPMRIHSLLRKKLTVSENNTGVALKQSSRTRVQTLNDDPTMTQQQFKEEADINTIMRKYGADPVAFNALTRKGGVYADFSQITDYHSMVQTVADAQDAFASLPAQIRSRFENDPGKLIAFLRDPKNNSEGIDLGLYESSPLQNKKTATSKNELNDKTEADPKKS